MMVAFHRKAPN